MWKCVSRRLKDTLERGASYFETRNVDASIHSKIVYAAKPLSVYAGKSNNCWSTFFGDGKNKTKNEKWYCGRLYSPWIGAITWSSALILGWYTSQLLCLSNRKYRNNEAASNPLIAKIHPLAPIRYVYSQPINVQPVNNSFGKRQNIGLLSQISLVSNESGIGNTSSSDSDISNKSINDAADNFSDVLNAIENKLGLAAIENGDFDGGISLLKSSASRNHAPALYNLGLCYENGLGTVASENTAMQYYRAAAILEHPTAMYNLAIFYGQGRGGLNKDKDTALRLLRMAASKGQKEAISLLEHSKSTEPPVHKQYKSDKYIDSPTRIFLKMIGADNKDISIRREELIY